MAVRCSPEQIADSVVLLGMTGRFHEYCKCADDARELKSLDLIISTMDVFIDAFCFSFEDIYRKYNVNFPLSKEKFITFLKPRCLLLTKDNSCFNFVLVCAFVHDIINSFSDYNKCFHLVKVASKCLATILKNRFKKIFETDSAWEELMSFCLKIHDLVCPPGNISECDNNQLVGAVTDNTKASFLNMTLGLANTNATVDKVEHSDMKTTGKKSCRLQNDLTTKREVGESEDLSILKFPTLTGEPLTPQLTGEVSFQSESEGKIVGENNLRTDNDKDCVKDSALTDLKKEFTNSINEKISNGKNVTENLKENLTRSFEGYVAIKTEAESLDLKILELHSIDAGHTLPAKIKDSPRNTTKSVIYDENDIKNNGKDCMTEMTDSSVSNSEKEFSNITINNKDEGTDLGQVIGFKNHLIPSFEKESVLHLRSLKLDSSIDASHTYHTSGENFTLNAEEGDNKVVNESDSKEGSENVTFPLVPHKLVKIPIRKKDIDKNLNGAEKLGQMNSCRKKLNLPLSKASSPQIVRKKYAGSHNLGSAASTDARPALQPRDEEFFLRKEMKGNDIDKNLNGAQKLGQMNSCRKKLSLGLTKNSSPQIVTKKIAGAHNLGSVASTDARPAIQPRDELFLRKELKDNENTFDIRRMSADKVRTRITDNPQHLLEIMNLLKKCGEDIEPNIFSPDEYDIATYDTDEEMEASCGFSESCTKILESIPFYQDGKFFIQNTLLEDDPSNNKSSSKTSGSEPAHEMGDRVAYCNRMFEYDDPRCSLCAGGMDNFFDACVYNFIIKYANNIDVSDYFRSNLQDCE